jgi:hypothetical protein
MTDLRAEAGGIITGIAAFVTALLAWFKWLRQKDVSKTEIYKAIEGNREIDMIMASIMKNVKNVVKVGLIETTNGGGIPLAGRATYKRIIACTDSSILTLFGDKTLNDKSYNEIIWQTLKQGEYIWHIKDIEDVNVLDLFKSTNIESGLVLLIGIERGVRILALVVDFNTEYIPSHSERVLMREARKRIGEIVRTQTRRIDLMT